MLLRVKCLKCGAVSKSGQPSDTCPGAEDEPCGALLRDAEVLERLPFNPKANYTQLPFAEWAAFSIQKRRALYGAALSKDPRNNEDKKPE